MSPRRTRMTSPGTSSRAGGVTHLPSRRTLASTASFALSAAMALPAWCSSQNPTMALARSRTRMMPKSGQCWARAERTTAASIIHGIGPHRYVRNLRNGLSFFSSISLGPYWTRRFAASAWLMPSGDDSSFAWSSGMDMDWRSLFALGSDPGLVRGLRALDFMMSLPRLYLCARRVGESSEWQGLWQVEASHADPVVGHAVIDIEPVGHAKIVAPVDAGGENDVGDRPAALLRQLGGQHRLGRPKSDHLRMLRREDHHPGRVAQVASGVGSPLLLAHAVVDDEPS